MELTDVLYDLKNQPLQIDTSLTAYLFEEENIQYAYLPVMAITGYGYTSQEAWDSLNIILSEFLSYAKEHDTLIPELKQLGWGIDESSSTLIPPTNTEMYITNKELREVIDLVTYTTAPVTIQLLSI